MTPPDDTSTAGDDALALTQKDLATARRTIALHRAVVVVCSLVLIIGALALGYQLMLQARRETACRNDAALDIEDVRRGLAEGVYPASLRVTPTPTGTLIEGRVDVFLVDDGRVLGASSVCPTG